MSTETTRDAVRRFVESYAANITTGDDLALTAQFAELFMAGGPSGISAVRAVDFARALPRRRQLFAALGCRSSSLVGVDRHPLTDRFWLVTSRWRMSFEEGEAGGAEEIASETIFIVDAGAEPFRIVMFLHGSDVLALRGKVRGLPEG